MSHRPHPNADRVRRQLARHTRPAPVLAGLADAAFLAKCAEFGAWLTSANLEAHLAARPQTLGRRFREARATLLRRLDRW